MMLIIVLLIGLLLAVFGGAHCFLVVPTGILSDVLLSEFPKRLHHG